MQGLHAGLVMMTENTLRGMAKAIVNAADNADPSQTKLYTEIYRQFCTLLVMTRPEPPPCKCRERKEES